jgi:tetratricopeptide (TPR) repeat protein
VALKLIKPGLDTRQVIARFEAERQALAMMEHENIAKVLDAGATDAGRPYFVMELVRGVPITDYCDQHQLTPRQRLELFIPVCQAVQHAHQKGIIHRDLKPSNVLVTLQDDGRPVPKVIDFGIAKATAGQPLLTDRTLFTEFRQLVGTPLYMAPEQVEPAASDIDTRADVYSLGVLLYELLTGTTPFDKQRLAKAAYDEVRRIIREEEPPRPSTRVSTLGDTITSICALRQTDPKRLSQTVRGELDWIVMKAIEKDRTRRYETPSDLARDVERYLSDQPVEACPPSRTYRLKKFARRNVAVILTASMMAAVLLAASVVSRWQAVRATRATATAQAAEQRANRDRDRALTAEKRALADRSFAEAAITFLFQEVLGAADPHAIDDAGSPTPDLTVREALDRAAAKLHAQFKTHPVMETNLRVELGRTYAQLGDFKKAEDNFKAAVHLLESSQADRAYSLGVINELGEFYLHRHRPDEAEPLLRRVADGYRALYGDGDRQTLFAMVSLAIVYDERGDHAGAARLELKIVETMRRTLGENDGNTLRVMHNLGYAYYEAGDYKEAQKVLLDTATRYRNAFPDDDAAALGALDDLAAAYRDAHEYDKAEACYRDVLRGYRRHYGDSHPQTRDLLSDMATMYEMQQRYADAEPCLREIAEWYLAHPSTSPTMFPEGTGAPAVRRLVICYRKLHQPKLAGQFEQRLRSLTAPRVEGALPATLPAALNPAADEAARTQATTSPTTAPALPPPAR